MYCVAIEFCKQTINSPDGIYSGVANLPETIYEFYPIGWRKFVMVEFFYYAKCLLFLFPFSEKFNAESKNVQKQAT